MTAYYNAPDRDADLVASFSNRPDAEAYAAEYGGEVVAIGTAFAVGIGADHLRAKDDAANGDGNWVQGRDKRTATDDASEVESVPASGDSDGDGDGDGDGGDGE